MASLSDTLDRNEQPSESVDQSASLSGFVAPPNWTEQDETLRKMWGENKTPEEIAQSLGRSVAAVMTRAARLGLPRRAAPGRKRGYKRTELRERSAVSLKRVRVRLQQSDTEAEERETHPNVLPMMRVCLMCLNKFQSEGRHNRICPSCKGSAEYATGSSTPDFTFRVST